MKKIIGILSYKILVCIKLVVLELPSLKNLITQYSTMLSAVLVGRICICIIKWNWQNWARICTEHNERFNFFSVWLINVSKFFKIFETRQVSQCASWSVPKKLLELSLQLTLAPSVQANKLWIICGRYWRSYGIPTLRKILLLKL